MYSMVIYKVSANVLLVCISDKNRHKSGTHGAYNLVRDYDDKHVNKHSVFNL